MSVFSFLLFSFSRDLKYFLFLCAITFITSIQGILGFSSPPHIRLFSLIFFDPLNLGLFAFVFSGPVVRITRQPSRSLTTPNDSGLKIGIYRSIILAFPIRRYSTSSFKRKKQMFRSFFPSCFLLPLRVKTLACGLCHICSCQ